MSSRTSSTRSCTASPAPTGARRHACGPEPSRCPRSSDGVVTAVLGLDDRPQARARSSGSRRRRRRRPATRPCSWRRSTAFPAGTDGTGQTVAIIELGGGFEQSDLDTYFGGLGAHRPPGDGGRRRRRGQRSPARTRSGADGEVLLDIEVVGALAPEGRRRRLLRAQHRRRLPRRRLRRPRTRRPTPVAISISWGQSEDQWTAQARTALDDAFADAVSTRGHRHGRRRRQRQQRRPATGAPRRLPRLEPARRWPAAAPACARVRRHHGRDGLERRRPGRRHRRRGQRRLRAAVVADRRRGADRAGATTAGRGVPDVAGDADPQTGYQVSSTARPRSSAAPARSRRSGPAWSPGWRSWRGKHARPDPAAPLRGRHGPAPCRACVTSPRATTGPTAPGPGGTPAPASACPTPPRRRC